MAPSFGWWDKEVHRGTPVIVKMENPNWSIAEISSPDDDEYGAGEEFAVPGGGARKGARGKNAKQITWVLLLKAHRAAGCLTSLASAAVGLASTVRRRVVYGRTDSDAASSLPEENPVLRSRFYSCIKVFLWLSVVLLGFEVAAYLKGWHLSAVEMHRLVLPSSLGVRGLLESLYTGWVRFRVEYIAPPLQFLADACVILFLIQSADRLILCLGCFWVRFKGIKPLPKRSTGASEDPESGGDDYPMVLVQIPMCNEKEVLDDSDDPTTQALIKEEVEKWQQNGAHIVYRHRVIRDGYKAGNLKSAMNCSYVKDYELVAIFDADFQPTPDFLKRTVPHFKVCLCPNSKYFMWSHKDRWLMAVFVRWELQDNEELGLVQARWSFVNKDENLLTRLQNINLCFHFEVEQQVNGVFINFFGFNGTAGVWRIKALEDAGGWLERTTVEDMDIAVRAHLNGWKFIYLNDVEIGFWKKSNLIFLFFLLRKLILPFYSFTLFCIILPLTMFVPEAELPAWVVCYIPAAMSFLNILPAPRSFPFIVPYLLFENTMSVTKFNAMISGLFQLGSAYEWVVTKKSGRSSEGDRISLTKNEPKQQQGGSAPNLDAIAKDESQPKKKSKKKHNRIYRKELALAFLLLTASARSLLSAQGIHFYFLLFQGISFLLVGLDLIGEQIV
ncbi:hypothetical protein B296_00035922 [Ensete ventricosum]|uniref:Glycosyltransferase 2-like domain-containing protein n=1 Tax=Ensete ventricosum TaxID=4639 RepID=A0A427A1B4_ENSVE|nr:hypothetical protein B296_00035922 [Ensete ventricosum]